MYYKDVEDDDHDRMTLLHACDGMARCEAFYNGYRMKMVKIKGRWYTLSHGAENPTYLLNAQLRSDWARVVGLPVGEVERYVRRVRDKCKRKALANEIENAKQLLEHQGYIVAQL